MGGARADAGTQTSSDADLREMFPGMFFGRRRFTRRKGCRSKRPMKKLPATIRNMCRKLGIKTTRKVGNKRVCKNLTLLKRQIAKKRKSTRGRRSTGTTRRRKSSGTTRSTGGYKFVPGAGVYNNLSALTPIDISGATDYTGSRVPHRDNLTTNFSTYCATIKNKKICDGQVNCDWRGNKCQSRAGVMNNVRLRDGSTPDVYEGPDMAFGARRRRARRYTKINSNSPCKNLKKPACKATPGCGYQSRKLRGNRGIRGCARKPMYRKRTTTFGW
jgi:hypothetical protein